MVLKTQFGATTILVGAAPEGAIQSVKRAPSACPSRATRGASTSPSALSAVASRNIILAPQSRAIAARLAGVEPGAKGATATPARSAPRKTTTYSIDAAA